MGSRKQRATLVNDAMVSGSFREWAVALLVWSVAAGVAVSWQRIGSLGFVAEKKKSRHDAPRCRPFCSKRSLVRENRLPRAP